MFSVGTLKKAQLAFVNYIGRALVYLIIFRYNHSIFSTHNFIQQRMFNVFLQEFDLAREQHRGSVFPRDVSLTIYFGK